MTAVAGTPGRPDEYSQSIHEDEGVGNFFARKFTESWGIPRNFNDFRDLEFSIFLGNFGQYPLLYGTYGSKKT
jgi:hypothetical protein